MLFLKNDTKWAKMLLICGMAQIITEIQKSKDDSPIPDIGQ